MVISELMSYVKSALRDNAAFEARQIVMRAAGVTEAELIIKSKAEASSEAVKRAEQMLSRRQKGEPLQYIFGAAEFMSLEFEVNSSTLIPRADTETLVEAVLDETGGEKLTLLDIGTGTGCVGISIARYSKAEVTLADISGEALAAAGRNAERNGVPAKLLMLDILKEVPRGRFDVVVSNPPYIESSVIPTLQTEVKDYEPLAALDGGADGMVFYRRITEIAPDILTENGLLAFEISYNQGTAVSELMKNDFENVKLIKDLCGNDRVVLGRLRS